MIVTAIVVTYNRPALLKRLLGALEGQTRRPDHLLVVDNASSSETVELLASFEASASLDTRVVRAPSNLGGAGGFALGMRSVEPSNGHWLWVMDDDAEPSSSCLERLLEAVGDAHTLVGPAAVGRPPCDTLLCWPVTLEDGTVTRDLNELEAAVAVQTLPFLGLLIPSYCIKYIGYPEERLFISSDDVDYTLRARSHGYALRLHAAAILFHPLPEARRMRLLWRTIWLQEIAPWKRYFEVRNRLWVARTHYGVVKQIGVLGVTIFRWIFTLIHMPQRLEQSRAYLLGIRDGLAGRIGTRPLGP